MFLSVHIIYHLGKLMERFRGVKENIRLNWNLRLSNTEKVYLIGCMAVSHATPTAMDASTWSFGDIVR